MMARAKRIYILIIKVNKLFSFFSSRCFLKGVENMFAVFLSSYRNTLKILGELEKAVTTLACSFCSHSMSSFSQTSSYVALWLDGNTENCSPISLTKKALKLFKTCFQESGGKYLIMMVDPDAPSRGNPTCQSWLHWIVGNIKVCEIIAY